LDGPGGLLLVGSDVLLSKVHVYYGWGLESLILDERNIVARPNAEYGWSCSIIASR
jgi:hypothetical protein